MPLHPTAVLIPLALLTLASPPRAQVAEPGFRLFSPNGSTETYLVDVAGQVVHTWTAAFPPGVGVHLDADGTLLRTADLPGGFGVGGEGGGVQVLALDGTLLWDYRYDGPGVLAHHDVERLPNGNVLVLAFEQKSVAEAIAAGRDPALLPDGVLLPEHVVEVEPTGPTTGTIVWEWHLWDHLIQDFDPTKANFGVVADHPELVNVNYPPNPGPGGDWIHLNAIDYDAEHDRILLCSPFLSEIWVIDHSTTTAEAAGHVGGTWGRGGDLLYRWGNPVAYDRGTPADQMLFGQHGAHFVPDGLAGAGRVLLFNNNVGGSFSAVWELELPTDASGAFVLPPGGTYGPAGPAWQYVAPTPTDLFSPFLSRAERMPNGHTLITSGVQGWIFEIDAAGQKVWETTTPGVVFHAHYVERTLWADGDSLSTSAGGAVGLDLIAGSNHAGEVFLVLGSLSGTAPGLTAFGVTLPLNPDVYLQQVLNHPTAAPLAGNLGALDALGSGALTFGLPAGAAAALSGLTAHHAYVLLDPGTLTVTHASNPVPLELLP
jgi:hypothetical protein